MFDYKNPNNQAWLWASIEEGFASHRATLAEARARAAREANSLWAWLLEWRARRARRRAERAFQVAKRAARIAVLSDVIPCRKDDVE